MAFVAPNRLRSARRGALSAVLLLLLCGCIATAEPEDFDIRPASAERIAGETVESSNFRERNWDRFDVDDDGALNRQEWRSLWWQHHLIWDVDGSGDFTLSEWVHRECGSFRSLALYQPCSRAALREFLTNTGSRDGRVTERQLSGSSDRFFRMNDANRDGVVTGEEVRGNARDR